MEENKPKKKKANRRRKLALYTKAPFNLTNEHMIAFLAAVKDVSVVQVTYKLTVDRTDVQSISFGGISVSPTGSGPVSVPVFNDMLSVLVRAEGKFGVGGGWSLAVSVNGSAISDSPIEEKVGTNNKADHDDAHLI